MQYKLLFLNTLVRNLIPNNISLSKHNFKELVTFLPVELSNIKGDKK